MTKWLIVVLAAGCASSAEPAVVDTAARFYAAVSAGQGGEACALLTDAAARSLPEPCATAILGLGLRGGPVGSSEVWGQEAQVRLSGDTVFLHRSPEGWRIRGAGCRPQGERPYDCEVSG
ncbi:hypothetical protein [Herbidospora cretacea]|uniref:hypothetical protein n=1 Tax=Herbidospora cretacea TaxID=28444 RepID=UPI000773DFF8|nr:hypothetical protein [Herbidospora cretacea]